MDKIIKVYIFSLDELLSKGILLWAVPQGFKIKEIKAIDDLRELLLTIEYEEEPLELRYKDEPVKAYFDHVQLRYHIGKVVPIYDEEYITTVKRIGRDPVIITMYTPSKK